MRYLLTSAVITAPGLYRYRLIGREEARRRLAVRGWQGRVAHAHAARYIRQALGVTVPPSREIVRMKPGDQAIVVRLNYRPQDAQMQRAQLAIADEDWEIGLLERIE